MPDKIKKVTTFTESGTGNVKKPIDSLGTDKVTKDKFSESGKSHSTRNQERKN